MLKLVVALEDLANLNIKTV